MKSLKIRSKTQALVFGALTLLLANACSLTVDISSNAPVDESIKKAKGAEMTSGGSREQTSRGYIVDSQLGHPFGAVVSKTDKNYTVYHSIKMGTAAE